jgi:hypothetical protein
VRPGAYSHVSSPPPAPERGGRGSGG